MDMNYRLDKYGNKISVLGFGCMRFPQKLGMIDKKASERHIMTAIASGVNFFDTAYMYPGSESALGEILEKNQVREQVRLATKLPHYLIKSTEGLEKLFNEQLKRLRTGYVDYYLMHMLSDIHAWDRLKRLGIVEWLDEKKRNGIIGQVGFSYHGNSQMFQTLLDAYDWDMCLIQYNYMDEHSQAGREGLKAAHEKRIAVFIMEPLRGGKLVSHLPESAKRIFADYPKKHSPAQWAFKWLWNQPEITCVLSGMNADEMIRDNVQTASTTAIGELGPDENRMLQAVVDAINAKMKVDCTGCGYCLPCPANVDIPGAFAAYNRRYTESIFWGFSDYVVCTAMRKDSTAASNCIGCGACEPKCPQRIAIRDELENVQKKLEGPIYKIARTFLRTLFASSRTRQSRRNSASADTNRKETQR